MPDSTTVTNPALTAVSEIVDYAMAIGAVLAVAALVLLIIFGTTPRDKTTRK